MVVERANLSFPIWIEVFFAGNLFSFPSCSPVSWVKVWSDSLKQIVMVPSCCSVTVFSLSLQSILDWLRMDGLCDVRIYFVPAFQWPLSRVTLYPLNPGWDSDMLPVWFLPGSPAVSLFLVCLVMFTFGLVKWRSGECSSQMWMMTKMTEVACRQVATHWQESCIYRGGLMEKQR